MSVKKHGTLARRERRSEDGESSQGQSFSGFQLHISAFGSNNPRQATTGGREERGGQSTLSDNPPHQLPRHTNPDWVVSKQALPQGGQGAFLETWGTCRGPGGREWPTQEKSL